jgi:molybdopterin converting factor small subunit
MPRVTLIGNLSQFTGGVATLDVPDATTIRQLFRRLADLHPELAPHLDNGLAVAIDGQIYQDDWLAPMTADSDVQILPQIAGG